MGLVRREVGVVTVTTAVSVLCARVRVEEKAIIAAFGEAGVPASPVPPVPQPLPIGPVPTGPLAAFAASGASDTICVDRCQNRVEAAAFLPLLAQLGARIIDAGEAATADRLAIARTLAAAGVDRPATMLAVDEETGLTAVRALGCPSTVLPVSYGEAEIALCDHDIAEAVLEHRCVLGGPHQAVSLIQAGGCDPAARRTIFVVGGQAIAWRPADAAAPTAAAIRLAEAAARALGAALIGIEISMEPNGPVVWDVQPVPEFREAAALGDFSVAEAVARLAGGEAWSGKGAGNVALTA